MWRCTLDLWENPGWHLPRSPRCLAHGDGPRTYPIAVAPLGDAEHTTPFATIGVGYDRSPESEAALEAAKLLAQRTRAEARA
jgi:hypothetical protein